MLALPATNRSEGFGMVFTEANATGTPVVGTRTGGIPYAVQDGRTGLLAEPGDPRSLRAAVQQILDDARVKWRVIIVSACYSGVFLDELENDMTLIITAALLKFADSRTPMTSTVVTRMIAINAKTSTRAGMA